MFNERETATFSVNYRIFSLRVWLLTVLSFAGAVVRLQQVSLHTTADVGALRIGARLTAGAVHVALVEICREERQQSVSRRTRGGSCVWTQQCCTARQQEARGRRQILEYALIFHREAGWWFDDIS